MGAKEILVAISTIVTATIQQVVEPTPRMVVELWRHGARVPAYNTFRQNYVDTEGPGNLAANGERMHYLLGKQIRKEYPSLFPEGQKNVTSLKYEVWATSYQRTIVSAYSHMMGLYPPGTGRVVSNTNDKTKLPPYKNLDVSVEGEYALEQGVSAIPVNIKTVREDDFFMKGIKYTCRGAYNKAEELFKAEVEQSNFLNEIGEKIKAAGYDCNDYFKNGKEYDLNTTGIFADVNKCYFYYYGVPMKGTEEFYDKMQYAFSIYYIATKYLDFNITKLYTTKMSQYIVDKMKKVISGKSELQYIGLSGHEASIFPYMMLYNLTSQDCMVKSLDAPVEGCLPGPEFAANIIWELAQDDQQQWLVKARFNGNLILKTCEGMGETGYCKFEDFESFMNDQFILSPEDYKATCGASTPSPSDGDSSSKVWMYIAIVLAVLFIGQLIYFVIYIQKTRKRPLLASEEGLTGEGDEYKQKR